MRTLFSAVLSGLILSGCAAPQQSIWWVKNGGSNEDRRMALAKCDYETSAATQATDMRYRSMLGQELERAIRKAELQKQCMYAQGYKPG